MTSSEARSFLASEGLPADHELFDASVATVEEHASGRAFLFVGEIKGVERYGIDIASGVVVAVNVHDSSVWFVNASVRQFALSLEAFTERFPFGTTDAEQEDLERAADEFRVRLLEIDLAALDEDPGHWHGLLHDIAIGDYSDEDD